MRALVVLIVMWLAACATRALDTSTPLQWRAPGDLCCEAIQA
ncbi:hypothetical protein [Phenylobacterium soli]|nr:hypothetical protein [Phenylobacterium soli]